MNRQAFSALIQMFRTAQARGLTDCTLLRYEGEDAIARSGEIGALLRQSDYLGSLGDGDLYILLPNADANDAQFAIKRLAAHGFEVSVVGETEL